MREIGVGIIGFGTVGTGVVKILQGNGDLIAERMGGRLAIRKIADIDLERKRDVEVPSFL
ncbi:MAG: homoserine dehydrogenase, partial [Deltaproteobacteria bacterium]